jgi:DNA-binding response OmpR family regulator
MKALLVDDNALIRKAFRMTLEAEGWICCEASNGADAIRRCMEESPEVCLLDLHLPDMDGVAVLRTLGAREVLDTMRVYIVSGRDDFAVRKKTAELGARGFLLKPITGMRLLEAIKED